MLELRPTCENCNRPLPRNATDAMICTIECTFCRDCVDSVLSNVCPNCGGGFERRPIRPARAWVEGAPQFPPPSTKVVHKPVDPTTHAGAIRRSADTVHRAIEVTLRGRPVRATLRRRGGGRVSSRRPVPARLEVSCATAGGGCRRSSGRRWRRRRAAARARCGLRDVDDLQDLGTAEAGDLHGSHARTVGHATSRLRKRSRPRAGRGWVVDDGGGDRAVARLWPPECQGRSVTAADGDSVVARVAAQLASSLRASSDGVPGSAV
jgi:uncharacterized protein